MRSASNARNTLPPSMGNAGTRLKAPRIRLRTARSRVRLPAVLIVVVMVVAGVVIVMIWFSARRIAPMRKLVSGPAMAMRHSILGFSGISSISDTPPIG